ncbi:MAG: TIGR03086 family metal-binding protein [Stackebrandtia sp.]
MDHRQQYRRAQLELSRVVAGIADEQLDLPTPCSEWTVKGLLRHLVAVNYGEVAAFADEPYDQETDPRLDTDLRNLYAEAADDAWKILAEDSALDRLVPFAGQDRPGWVRISFHFIDAFIHTWDLRRAVGRPAPLDQDLVPAALEVAGLIPDDDTARGPGKAFGPALPSSPEASDAERLLRLVGRSPE